MDKKKKQCEHVWDALDSSHVIDHGKGPIALVVYEVCHKCDSAQKKAYTFID